jgi:hypothetical protein
MLDVDGSMFGFCWSLMDLESGLTAREEIDRFDLDSTLP